uniref:Uncharacterized protein n=1 Tax=Romanomermis culicivorax TaxID=13658 RepID=A0A915I2V7_ROMCU
MSRENSKHGNFEKIPLLMNNWSNRKSEDLEDMTFTEEEGTLDNVTLDEDKGTILYYDDDEKEQYNIHTPQSSNEEEIYGSVQTGGG